MEELDQISAVFSGKEELSEAEQKKIVNFVTTKKKSISKRKKDHMKSQKKLAKVVERVKEDGETD